MATVIYDSDCGFCKWCLAVVLTPDRSPADGRGGDRGRREDGRPSTPDLQVGWGRSAALGALRPLPLGTPEADRLLADLTPEERSASWHLVDDAGARISAGAALAPALSLVRGGRIPAWALSRMPGVTERGYRWVAAHRMMLGRFVSARMRGWAERVIAAHGQAGT